MLNEGELVHPGGVANPLPHVGVDALGAVETVNDDEREVEAHGPRVYGQSARRSAS